MLLDRSQQLQHAGTDETIVVAVKSCGEDMNQLHKSCRDGLALSHKWILLKEVTSSPFRHDLKQLCIQCFSLHTPLRYIYFSCFGHDDTKKS
uniref:Uncharacterized protein n=1 Tax=Arundo donax TaxID=35708 RepID=A0A0A9AB66_ARUDO